MAAPPSPQDRFEKHWCEPLAKPGLKQMASSMRRGEVPGIHAVNPRVFNIVIFAGIVTVGASMAMPAQADGGSAIEQCRRYQRDSSVAQPIGSSDGVPRQCSTYHGDVRRLHGINLPSPLLCFCICLVGGSSKNSIEMCLCICMCGSCDVGYRHIYIVRYTSIYIYICMYIYIDRASCC